MFKRAMFKRAMFKRAMFKRSLSRSRIVLLTPCLAFLCLQTPSLAQENPAGKELPDVILKTTSVAAFKNGLGFFIRQGAANLKNGQGRIPFVPEASLGSLWLAPNDSGTTLEELVAYRYKLPKEHSVASLQELLHNNVGKSVTVGFINKEYTGEMLGISGAENATVPISPAGAGQPPTFPALQSQLLLLKVDGKVLALNPAYINSVSLPDKPNLVFTQNDEAKALRFTLKNARDTASLTLGYLQKGLGWTPSYLISLQDEKNARITMQAVLTNDAEDLAGADVFFVVGVPNFEYSDKLSPMALQQTLTEFMQDAARRDFDRTNQFSNAVMGQRLALPISGRNTVDLNSTVGEIEGAPEEDLFLYTRPGVTLAKGERATYNIFAAPAACEHIYEWQVTDSPQVDIYGNPQNSNLPSDQKDINTVWHSLRLKNAGKFPWTSAPAMVISGTQPVSQDTLSYTPKGASTNLKLTIATDVRTDKIELEVDRQPRALNRNGTQFDSVTVEGTLKVKNYKSKDIALRIYRNLIGEVLSATDNGKTEKLAEVIRALNPTSRVTWDLTLKAGEEKVITYRYKILVRS